jgi:hypothetical protein
MTTMGFLSLACGSDGDDRNLDTGGSGGAAGTGGSVGGEHGGLDASSTTIGSGGAASDAGSEAGPPIPVALEPLDYSDESLWLCLPGRADHCTVDQTVTAILPDDTTETRPPISDAIEPIIDCFYVYPTVAITDAPGNRTEFDNVEDILDPLMAQFAPFKDLCAQYAPLYRQVTFSVLQDPTFDRDGFLDIAFQDVANAFDHYLSTHNDGRAIVLIGHSQGALMLRRLLQRRFENDAALSAQLLVAMLIGSVGDVVVPDGEIVGGTFSSIPLCTGDSERGCVITFNSYGEAHPPQGAVGAAAIDFDAPPGSDWACTNPGALGGGASSAAGALAPSIVRQSILDPQIDWGVTSDLVLLESYYSTECKKNAEGKSFLSIAPTPEVGDERTDRIPYDAPLFNPAFLGLHLMDFVFPMQELKDQLRSRM